MSAELVLLSRVCCRGQEITRPRLRPRRQPLDPPGRRGTACRAGKRYHLRVTASGPDIEVHVDDMTTPKLTATVGTFPSGANGVRVYDTAASFDDVSVRHR